MCESSNGSMQESCISDDIIGCSSLKDTESDDSSLDRIDITADNRLNLSDKIASCNQSVVCLMWKGSVTTFTLEANLDFASSCKECMGIGRNLSNF